MVLSSQLTVNGEPPPVTASPGPRRLPGIRSATGMNPDGTMDIGSLDDFLVGRADYRMGHFLDLCCRSDKCRSVLPGNDLLPDDILDEL